ncbi:hypothetical protein [Paludibacter sp.]|uniref:hypothetical protein n=1 Tax=Paludibacter sp. TaxID=1898105 RepID=UPI001353C515|nr:hypothetical protein [Paludibacter sp.]MTK52639.1 hypothetical protein [Paludibacter sp.]
MAGCFLPAFAQRVTVFRNKLLQPDSTLYQRALKNNQTAIYTWKSDNSKSKLNNPATDNLNLTMKSHLEMEKMPCVKSPQKFRMPVSKSDTVVKRTMLIKKF